MGDPSRGMYNKFSVLRTDGTDAPGKKHDGCQYFVLDVTHDPHAVPALRAYADSCRSAYPLLARDLDTIAHAQAPAATPEANTQELLDALDVLYPLSDDAHRVERAGRTAAVLKRFLAAETRAIEATALSLLRVQAPAATAPHGWRPIDSAPKDGTSVLVHDEGATMIAWFNEDDGVWFDNGPMNPPPQFWMPLPPDPPAAALLSARRREEA